MWFLLFPVLACLLFAAHLMFHGLTLYCLFPILLIFTLFIPSRWVRYLMQVALVVFTCEWIWTTYLLYVQRASNGRPFMTAVCILLAVAAFTALSALVFNLGKVKKHYR